MYAKYSPRKYITVTFDLEHDRETGTAFSFFFAGVTNTPFLGDVKEKLEAMVRSLRNDVLRKVAIDQECANFQLCIRCATEVDLRGDNFSQGKDGAYFHKTCPILKSNRP